MSSPERRTANYFIGAIIISFVGVAIVLLYVMVRDPFTHQPSDVLIDSKAPIEARIRAAHVLASSADPEGIERLRDFLKANGSQVNDLSTAILEELRISKSGRAVEALVAAFKEAPMMGEFHARAAEELMDTEDPQAISALVAALRDAGAHGVMDFAAAKALIQGGSSIVITPLRAEMSSDNLDVRFNFVIVLLSIDGLHNEGSDEIVAHALRSSYRRIFASCSFTVKEDQNLFDGVKPVGCEEFPGGCSWNGWSVAKAKL